MSEKEITISLRVQEAKKRDIGQNIVRINLETMQKMNIYTDEVIALVGEKEIEIKVWLPLLSLVKLLCF